MGKYKVRKWSDAGLKLFREYNKTLIRDAECSDNLVIMANAQKTLSEIAFRSKLHGEGIKWDLRYKKTMKQAQEALEQRLTPQMEAILDRFLIQEQPLPPQTMDSEEIVTTEAEIGVNIYKDFVKQNPGVLLQAKASKLKTAKTASDESACCLLAAKAQETAEYCVTKNHPEKAMYYFSKASKWYAAANNNRWEAMNSKITIIAKRY